MTGNVVKAAARGLAQRAVKVSAGLADEARRPAPGVVVLIYHRVGLGAGGEIDLDPAVFDRQMESLAASGRAVTLDRALEALAEPSGSPPHPVVVTFDDGTADFADVAVPILARHQVPALLYLATDFVERGVPFPNDGRPLSWAALGDALTSGVVTVGSHTHTHALLDRASNEQAAEELNVSSGLIQDRLGVAAEHFAYPKAILGSPGAEAEVRKRFRSAAIAGTAPNPYGRTDAHRLARSPIQVADGMRWFQRKVDGGMALEDTMRQVLNRRRYAGATT